MKNSKEARATTEAEIKNFSFNKTASGASSWSDFAIAAQIKTSSAAQAATLLVYIDAEGTARATVTTTATAYDVQATLDIAISDLTTGNHTVKIKLKSADGVATASNKKLDFFLVADTTASLASIEIDMSDMVVGKTIQMDGELEPGRIEGVNNISVEIGKKDLEAAKIVFAVE